MMIGFRKSATLKKIVDNQDSIDNGMFIWCDETERLYIKMKDKIIGITPAKREIKKISCTSCGAPMMIPKIGSLMTCKYCGSVYDIESYTMDKF